MPCVLGPPTPPWANPGEACRQGAAPGDPGAHAWHAPFTDLGAGSRGCGGVPRFLAHGGSGSRESNLLHTDCAGSNNQCRARSRLLTMDFYVLYMIEVAGYGLVQLNRYGLSTIKGVTRAEAEGGLLFSPMCRQAGPNGAQAWPCRGPAPIPTPRCTAARLSLVRHPSLDNVVQWEVDRLAGRIWRTAWGARGPCRRDPPCTTKFCVLQPHGRKGQSLLFMFAAQMAGAQIHVIGACRPVKTPNPFQRHWQPCMGAASTCTSGSVIIQV